ncbi:MAG: biopolymer transporter ExbD [Planctomycetota bacterium]|nr:biopolymer transporter ExbD [Planctomycetota bacterium]MDA1215052.1 biopolymer transporter ExbD [Planctomycetota bacterium]
MAKRSLFNDIDDGFAPTPREPDEADIDITPMIDCVFQLLIFFMVTSTMQSTPDLDVPTANYGTGVETESALILTILAGDPPRIIQGDGEGIEVTIDGVSKLVSDNMQKQQNHVIIKAERQVAHGFVQSVARAVIEVEGAQFYIGVNEEK